MFASQFSSFIRLYICLNTPAREAIVLAAKVLSKKQDTGKFCQYLPHRNISIPNWHPPIIECLRNKEEHLHSDPLYLYK